MINDIVIIDDDPLWMRLLSDDVRRAGFNPLCFENTRPAIQAIESREVPPLAYLVDMKLWNELEGSEAFFRYLASNYITRNFFYMTSNISEHDKQVKERTVAEVLLKKNMVEGLEGILQKLRTPEHQFCEQLWQSREEASGLVRELGTAADERLGLADNPDWLRQALLADYKAMVMCYADIITKLILLHHYTQGIGKTFAEFKDVATKEISNNPREILIPVDVVLDRLKDGTLFVAANLDSLEHNEERIRAHADLSDKYLAPYSKCADNFMQTQRRLRALIDGIEDQRKDFIKQLHQNYTFLSYANEWIKGLDIDRKYLSRYGTESKKYLWSTVESLILRAGSLFSLSFGGAALYGKNHKEAIALFGSLTVLTAIDYLINREYKAHNLIKKIVA